MSIRLLKDVPSLAGARRNSEALCARISSRLFRADDRARGLHVYGLVDAARDPRIAAAVAKSGLEQQCLYVGDVAAEIVAVAPHLVRLYPDARLANELITFGWGECFASYLFSPAPFSEVHRHLRRFLKVKDERGKTLLFRFYDPRVLRVYLPTCTEAEHAEFYGPIVRFVAEGIDRETALEFDRGAGGFRSVTETLGDGETKRSPSGQVPY